MHGTVRAKPAPPRPLFGRSPGYRTIHSVIPEPSGSDGKHPGELRKCPSGCKKAIRSNPSPSSSRRNARITTDHRKPIRQDHPAFPCPDSRDYPALFSSHSVASGNLPFSAVCFPLREALSNPRYRDASSGARTLSHDTSAQRQRRHLLPRLLTGNEPCGRFPPILPNGATKTRHLSLLGYLVFLDDRPQW